MLIFLNTFDECQTDKSPSLFFLFFTVCLSLPLSYTPTSPFLSSLSFQAETFETNESLLILSYKLLNVYLPVVFITRYLYYRQPERWDVGCSQWKRDVLCHVCNDRQRSAFRVPAFIIVNVDDTGLLPSWQTVMELSGFHNHCLALLWSPLTDECQPFGNVCSCVGGRKTA